ncbi:MAG: ribonuclease III [Bacteroidetes bacterium HGW-Bacteroidetes-15]|nr:MAG: ribonuclease III [Bacteroidetes bacterium HGW-Bacteroidetes-15]
MNEADKDFLLRLRHDFGIKPKNIDLYKIAVIHKSASTIISNGKKVNNERLEYLGDSVLDAIVADFLFANFPHQNEGFLTKMRSRIVSRYSLNNIALAIGLDKLVISQTNNPLAHKHIFGDALEAFVGAIYLDLGFKATSHWINKYIFTRHIDLNELQSIETDYKSRVIELAQKFKYNIVFDSQESSENKSQNPLFESKLFLNNKLLGTGFGTSKKEAEQNAAMVAIERIDIIHLPEQQVKPEAFNWEN